jgi:hypothetical protein
VSDESLRRLTREGRNDLRAKREGARTGERVTFTIFGVCENCGFVTKRTA